MTLKPIADRVIIEPLKLDEKTPGGIWIPDMAKKNQNIGVIKAVGPGLLHSELTELSVGDRVIFEANAGTGHEEAGIAYRIVRKCNILLKY